MSSFIDFEPDEREEESLRMIPPETPISTANRLGRATMEEVRRQVASIDTSPVLTTSPDRRRPPNASPTRVVQGTNEPDQQAIFPTRATTVCVTGAPTAATESAATKSRRHRCCRKGPGNATEEAACQESEQPTDTNYNADGVFGKVHAR